MKVTSIARVTMGTLFLCFALGSWFFISSFICIVKSCSFMFDGYFSDSIKQNIRQFGQEKFIKKAFKKVPLEALKTEFPLVAQVDATYHYGGKVDCYLKALKPLITINNNFVMVAPGNLLDISIFAPAIVNQLPLVTMKEDNGLSVSNLFKEFVNNFPCTLFEHFSITWIDHTIIELNDKNSSNFFLIAHYKTDFNQKLLSYYEHLKQQIMSQRSYAKKRWRIDVRFKNQIIVTQRDVGDS